MSKCLKREDIFKYSKEQIPKDEERRIEGHIFGDEIGIGIDKELDVEVRFHEYNGCVYCLKILAEINQSPDSVLSQHIV